MLDYVYAYDYAGGYPLLYALRSGAQPIGSPMSPDGAKPAPDPFLHVRTDGTPEGFFELTVLRIMGEQFYLWWHANYNDLVPVCGKKTLLYSVLQFHLFCTPEDLWESIKMSVYIPRAETKPNVKLGDKTATVSLLTFTKWGGLSRRTYEYQRSFPHKLMKYDREVLVRYSCGVEF